MRGAICASFARRGFRYFALSNCCATLDECSIASHRTNVTPKALARGGRQPAFGMSQRKQYAAIFWPLRIRKGKTLSPYISIETEKKRLSSTGLRDNFRRLRDYRLCVEDPPGRESIFSTDRSISSKCTSACAVIRTLSDMVC